tara:strand:+ start:98 stop:676 length:579 start_codon:yes stop_codon:yes gene_type:complete
MYILFTGAPGSKWSSVAESIYHSPDIDQSDSTSERRYLNGGVKHVGSYFDPGMEFDNAKENWDKPFSGSGKRIIKSHTFSHKLDELKTLGYPIVIIYRSHLECFDWWIKAGGFDITYPDYSYFGTNNEMKTHILKQNRDITKFIQQNIGNIECPIDNIDLCRVLKIKSPDPKLRIHNYAQRDTKVYVYRSHE